MGKRKTTSITNNDLANLTLIGTLAGVFLSKLKDLIPDKGNKEEEDDLKRIDFIMYYIKAFRDGYGDLKDYRNKELEEAISILRKRIK